MTDLLDLLFELCDTRAVAGSEGQRAEKISEIAGRATCPVSADIMGNIVAHKKGDGPRVLVTAGMDSPGLVVTYIDAGGFIRFAPVGGTEPENILGARVIFEGGAMGIVALDGKADPKELKADRMYIDIGAKDEARALKAVRLGETASALSGLDMAGDRVTASNAGTVACCASVLLALETLGDCKNDLYFVFAAQSRVGSRGIKTAAHAIDPDYILAIETARAEDTPDSSSRSLTKLGAGPCIKLLDDSIICHPIVVDVLKRAAEVENITPQLTAETGGRSAAAPVHMTRGGVYAGSLCLPVRYSGTRYEMCDTNDIVSLAKLTAAFCAAIDKP